MRFLFREQFLQRFQRGFVASLAEQPHRCGAMPLVWMTQQRDQLGRLFLREVEVLFQRSVFSAQAVDAAGGRVELTLVVLSVSDVFLVEVSDKNRAVGRVREEDGAECDVVSGKRNADVARGECRADGDALGCCDVAVQRVGTEQFSAQRRDGCAFGHDDVVRESLDWIRAFHRAKFAERKLMSRRAKLAGVFALLEVDAVLDEVPAARVAAVVSAKEISLCVELQTERVAAAFGENLECLSCRMIAPDHAALEIDGRRVESRTGNAASHGAALPAVEPAIRPPHESVCDAVRVFQTEACEPHFGWPVGNVVGVFIRVKHEIRRVHHPDSAVAVHCGVGHVQAFEHVFVFVENAVAVRVFMHRNDVRAAVVIRRRRRHFVEHRAVVLIATELPDSRRIRILTILRNPQPPAFVERHVRGLRDERLCEHQLHRETRLGAHFCKRFRRREPLARNVFRCGER